MRGLAIVFVFILPVLLSTPAFSQPGGCANASSTAANSCQFEVLSNTLAPAHSVSAGIRQDNNTENVLYDDWTCRFVDNNSGHDLFVPQNTAREFNDFLSNSPQGVTTGYCVLSPMTYTATSTCNAQIGTPVQTISGLAMPSAPSVVSSPVVNGIARYVAVPLTTATLGTKSPGSVIQFSYTINPTTTILEDQSVVFTATGMPGNYVWGAPVVSSVFWESQNGGAYKSLGSSCPALASTCGIANGTKTSSAPTSELCINGSAPSAVSQDNNGYEWSCSSLDGEGTSSNCSAPEAKGIALCGSANGTAPGSSPPTENLCSPGFGTPGPVSEYYGEYMWECDTEDATVWCGQWELGVCGAANGVAAGSPPTANLCQVGIPSTVTFSEANNSIGWAWTCTSPVPGSGILAVNCSAPTIGACGPANGVAVNYNQIMGTPYLEPYANLSILCTPGSGMGLHTSAPEFASGGSLWWECVGSAQGTAPGEQGNPVACSAPINGQCGNPDSIGETSDWAYYLCAGGIPSAVVNGDGSSPSGWNSGPWTWTCGNQPGATTVSCSQP